MKSSWLVRGLVALSPIWERDGEGSESKAILLASADDTSPESAARVNSANGSQNLFTCGVARVRFFGQVISKLEDVLKGGLRRLLYVCSSIGSLVLTTFTAYRKHLLLRKKEQLKHDAGNSPNFFGETGVGRKAYSALACELRLVSRESDLSRENRNTACGAAGMWGRETHLYRKDDTGYRLACPSPTRSIPS